jgi:hypothetical protein
LFKTFQRLKTFKLFSLPVNRHTYLRLKNFLGLNSA